MNAFGTRDFITKLTVPTRLGQYSQPQAFFNPTDTAKVYNTLVMIAHLTKVVTDNSGLGTKPDSADEPTSKYPTKSDGFS